MKRRHFLCSGSAALAGTALVAKTDPQEFALDRTRLTLWREENRVFCTFTAPTQGWLAVGFNNEERLRDTRFVIGAMIGESFHFEEHVAQVSDHARVQDAGLVVTADDVSGARVGDGTIMRFSMPMTFPDSNRSITSPKNTTYVMRAWSHHTDFDHHSAWRRHALISI